MHDFDRDHPDIQMTAVRHRVTQELCVQVDLTGGHQRLSLLLAATDFLRLLDAAEEAAIRVRDLANSPTIYEVPVSADGSG